MEYPVMLTETELLALCNTLAAVSRDDIYREILSNVFVKVQTIVEENAID